MGGGKGRIEVEREGGRTVGRKSGFFTEVSASRYYLQVMFWSLDTNRCVVLIHYTS